ncbi:type II secretion system F family protein [Mycolicibacterium litorale]|uniref:type II secretion system F family protein n=1 Tax=Mycolicibacterium litorale TaxID=758802 RepID=UPI003CF600EA
MSVAALALALAVLLNPVDVSRRLRTPGPRPHNSRRPGVLIALAGAAAVTVWSVAPAGAVLAAVIAGATAAVRIRNRRAARRRDRESESLQGALEVLVSELRVGAHPVAAFEAAAGETGGRVGESLRGVAARARLGADVGAGLHDAARGSELAPQWKRIAVCWQLAQDHGLSIATLMQTAQRDIAERQRFSSRVDAGMAGARATAAVLAALPVLGIGLGQLIGAEPVRFLFTGGAGGWLLAIGVALSCVGLLWSDRITTGVTT